MSNPVATQQPQLPARLGATIGGVDANDDLSSGVSGGFAVVSYRGSKWRVKHAGEENLVTNDDGEAAPSIQVVMIKGNRHISKNFYAGSYQEGSNDSPTCWSVDGVKPDAAVPQPISPSCAACPNNAFGSRITESGSKAKACGDSRRLAVVPIQDLSNEMYGGPMLLRVPAASLSDLATYGKQMKAKGFPYNTVVTRVGFDNDVAYPKLAFKPVRPLTPEEEQTMLDLLQDAEYQAKITNVLAVAIENVPAQPVVDATPATPPPPAATPAAPPPPADPFAFEQPPSANAAAAKKPAAPKKAAAPVKQAAAPVAQAPAPVAQAPATETAGETELDDDISAILSKLDSMD